jgi:hypothetical protein
MLDESTIALANRFIRAIELIAEKPPAMIVVPKGDPTQSVKDEPKTADGQRWRHALKSGGYLIEILVNETDVAFVHEDNDGNRNLLVFKPTS